MSDSKVVTMPTREPELNDLLTGEMTLEVKPVEGSDDMASISFTGTLPFPIAQMLAMALQSVTQKVLAMFGGKGYAETQVDGKSLPRQEFGPNAPQEN